jgi:aminopeptidase N
MPMRLALFAPDGEPLPLDGDGSLEWTVDIRDPETRLEFDGLPAGAMLSAFRGFSAPVIVTTDLDDDELARLMVCDSDAFNRWEAGQQLATRILLAMLEATGNEHADLQQPLLDAFASLLDDVQPDRALLAEMLVLPGEKYLAEMLEQADVHAIRQARETLALALAKRCEASLLRHYEECNQGGEYSIEAAAIARRRLKNTCLSCLLRLERADYFALCGEQFDRAGNMTDQIACLQAVVDYRHAERERIVAQFYRQWRDTPLVVDKWFSARGSSHAPAALEDIGALFDHPAYNLHNPNRARSLLGSMMANTVAFHRPDGAGYALAADKILQLDGINPQVAARLANPFVHWRRLVPELGSLMKEQVENMLSRGDLSNDLDELLSASLED